MSIPSTFAAFEPVGGPGPREAWLARPYSQLLRGPTLKWWRGPLSLLVVAGVLFLSFLVLGLVSVLAPASQIDLSDNARLTPAALLLTNLMLATFMPAAMIGIWGGYGWRPRWVASVVSGLRWAWLVRCAAISLVVVLVGDGIGILVDGGMPWQPDRQWYLYAVVILVTTPLQAAGEEYLFRGWLTQSIGSYLARPVVGAVLAGGVSSVLFALAHGGQDPWLFIDRLAFGIAASWLVWRTGGLEASIALHAMNNLTSFAVSIASGSMAQALNVTSSTPLATMIDLVIIVGAVFAIDRAARRSAIRRMFAPPVR
jgi:uncharacterized protein